MCLCENVSSEKLFYLESLGVGTFGYDLIDGGSCFLFLQALRIRKNKMNVYFSQWLAYCHKLVVLVPVSIFF